jgi:hypothetical protein
MGSYSRKQQLVMDRTEFLYTKGIDLGSKLSTKNIDLRSRKRISEFHILLICLDGMSSWRLIDCKNSYIVSPFQKEIAFHRRYGLWRLAQNLCLCENGDIMFGN